MLLIDFCMLLIAAVLNHFAPVAGYILIIAFALLILGRLLKGERL